MNQSSIKTPSNVLFATSLWRKTPKGLLTNIYQKQKERSKKRNHPMPDYTLLEFQNIFLTDEQFLKVYSAWIDSGYEHYARPSFDRIDNSLPYTLNNIQVMTWRENRRKGEIESTQITTPVIQKCLNGEVLAKYKSIKDAVMKTGFCQGLISACCNGKRNHTGGYRFEYEGFKRKGANGTHMNRHQQVISNIHEVKNKKI